MKDKRTYYGTMNKSQSDQQICDSMLISCIVRKTGPILSPLVVLMAGRLADKILVDFKLFENLYYLDFYFA